MIFQDQLIALLKNPGEDYGYRMYEVDHTGLLLYSRRCYDTDPLGSPGYECSRDSKRSLDNNNVHGVEPSLNYGFYNFETEDEEIVDVYIDQPKQVIIFIQVNTTSNYTRVYINPLLVNNRRSQFINILPEYKLIGQIDSFVAYRTVRHGDSIYMIDESSPHTIKKVDIEVTWDGRPFLGGYTGSISSATLTTHVSQILDITYDTLRDAVVCLTDSSILTYDGAWSQHTIPSTSYVKEYRSITHDYANDLYFIGNMSGVGSQYNFQGPTRSLMDLDNVLNEASIFTIYNPTDGSVSDVPYISIPNQSTYRYPIIVPIDIPAGTPILPCKTYCNIGRIRYYNMNGISKIICSDDFIYKVYTESENTYIYRSILSYSGYANTNTTTEIIEGVLTTIATTDDLNAIENIESNMAKWISFDYGNFIDEDCNKVIINDVKICHTRSNRCVGSDNYVRNGDFVYGLNDWYDSNDNPFPDPYSPTIYDVDNAFIKLHVINGIKQFINVNGRISLEIAFTAQGYTDPNSSITYKFLSTTGNILYEEEIKLKDIAAPYIYNVELAIEADQIIVEFNDNAAVENSNGSSTLNLDYILICDISGERICQPGYELLSYDTFIDSSSWEILSDPNFECSGDINDSISNDSPPGIVPSNPDTQPAPPPPAPPSASSPITLPSLPPNEFINGHKFYMVERIVDDKGSQNPSNATILNKLYSLSLELPSLRKSILEKGIGIETEWVINNQNNFNQLPNVPMPIDGPFEFVYSPIDFISTEDYFIGFMNSSLYRWQNQRPRWLSSYIETPIEISQSALTAVDHGKLGNDDVFYIGTMSGEGRLPCPGDYSCNSNLFLSSSWVGQLHRYTYKDKLLATTPTQIRLDTKSRVPVAIKCDGAIVSIVSTIKYIGDTNRYQFYSVYDDENLTVDFDISQYPTATCIDHAKINDVYVTAIGMRTGKILVITHTTQSILGSEIIDVTTDDIYEINMIIDSGILYFVTSTRSEPIRYTFGLDRANLLRVSDEDRGPQDFNCIYKNNKCTPTDYSEALQRLSFGRSSVYVTDMTTKSSHLIYSSNNSIVKLKKDVYSKFS